jgi:hypothetical protein
MRNARAKIDSLSVILGWEKDSVFFHDENGHPASFYCYLFSNGHLFYAIPDPERHDGTLLESHLYDVEGSELLKKIEALLAKNEAMIRSSPLLEPPEDGLQPEYTLLLSKGGGAGFSFNEKPLGLSSLYLDLTAYKRYEEQDYENALGAFFVSLNELVFPALSTLPEILEPTPEEYFYLEPFFFAEAYAQAYSLDVEKGDVLLSTSPFDAVVASLRAWSPFEDGELIVAKSKTLLRAFFNSPEAYHRGQKAFDEAYLRALDSQCRIYKSVYDKTLVDQLLCNSYWLAIYLGRVHDKRVFRNLRPTLLILNAVYPVKYRKKFGKPPLKPRKYILRIPYPELLKSYRAKARKAHYYPLLYVWEKQLVDPFERPKPS